MSGGVYAPDIKYNPHNGLFYMITTGTGYGSTSIVTTDDPKKGNWSDPFPLNEVHGIDPSLYFDEDGKAYIVNNDAPAYPPEYDGHRAIWIREFDWKNNRTVGEAKVIIDKGVHKEDKPIWIEGPHLYKINSIYYLMAAEGGTAEWHSEVIFRADNPMGPFTPCPINPILTQRLLPKDRPNLITSAGHADLVQTAAGNWYAVFLACMPYRDNMYNTGRETFMLPVTWKEEQPIILDNGQEIPYFIPKSEEQLRLEKKYRQKGFDFYNPGPLWSAKGLANFAVFVRNPQGDFYETDKKGCLQLTCKEVGLNQRANPAFIAQRLTYWYFTVQSSMKFIPLSPSEFAGLACFQNEDYFMQFGKTVASETGKPIVVLEAIKGGKCLQRFTTNLSDKDNERAMILRIQAKRPDAYTFSYSTDQGKTWSQVGDPLDASILSTRIAGGFQGVTVGVYATSRYEKLQPVN
jgi:beta-xylosidase